MSSGCNLVCLDNGVCREIVSQDSTLWIEPELNDLTMNKIEQQIRNMLLLLSKPGLSQDWRIDLEQRSIVEQKFNIAKSMDLWKKVIGITKSL